MPIAFYAPLKPPTHPIPSGDRRMARLLMAALRAAGHEVELASTFRSYDGAGDAARQARIRALGERAAARLLARLRARPAPRRPTLWFTYHLYHKAPDWLGPPVARGLAIPYVVAEASHAEKQRGGPWAAGHAAAAAAVAGADLVLALNTADVAGVRPLLSGPGRLLVVKPFIDARPYLGEDRARERHRRDLAGAFGLDPAAPWLLTVAMMRAGDKLRSYGVLGAALGLVRDLPWRLLVAGDGPARSEVVSRLSPLGDRVAWLGARPESELPSLYAAADLYLWPAVNEAYGVALLEAQAAGLPVIAGRAGGVADVVREPDAGVLVPPEDAQAFAGAVARLVGDEPRRRAMGRLARERIMAEHDLPQAAAVLDGALRRVLGAGRGGALA
jgi:glycosyltransferase involved in cell wall biosynthesis